MPYIETPEELAEEIADQLGIYGAGQFNHNSNELTHPEDCNCRICFVMGLANRIRESRDNEIMLERARKLNPHTPVDGEEG